jgi:prephenate dehydratase
MGKIAFQGELGANSHIACQTQYREMEPLPCATFDDAFEALKSGEADLAMMPVENTVAGRVADIHRLLPGSNLYIIGEHFMRVNHCLLALPGTQEGALTHVHSHEMALGQCRKIISELELTPQVAADTAGSARDLAASQTPNHGAIASKLAGEIYGLDVLRENIEDSQSNTTRFLVMSATPDDAEPETTGAPSGEIITSFIFRVRNTPSALYKALGGFATNNINMTKLESYQPNGFLATQFYADIEGHPDSEPVRLALEELNFYCSKMDILGVYKAAPERAALKDA